MVSMTPVDRAIVKIGREQFDTAVIQAERLFLAAIGSTGRSEAFAQLLSEHESGMVRDQTVDAVKIPMQSVSVVLNNLAESAGYSALAAVEFTIPDWMIAKAKVTVDFDPNTTAMRQIISNEVSGMTTLLDASTADSLRIVLARGTQMSWTPDQMSRALKQTLGLDPRYTLAAENYRQGLINKGTKPGVVNKLTSEYTQRLRKNRAETIVRTEVQRVLVAAQEEAWSQAERNLGVRGNKVWLTAEDEMSCSICAPMHGAEANVGGVFSNGLNPPAHPNCRCAVSLRFPMPTTLKTAIKKGDKPGHPFRGNQWTNGNSITHRRTYEGGDGKTNIVEHNVHGPMQEHFSKKLGADAEVKLTISHTDSNHRMYVGIAGKPGPLGPKYGLLGARDASMMSWHPKTGRIEALLTEGEFQRKGFATDVFDAATTLAKQYGLVPPRHSDTLTTDGAEWMKAELRRKA